MTLMIEREVKLRFDSPEAARAAVLAAGATPLRCRRLQEDALLDTDDEMLRRRQCALRIRTDSGKSLLTFKGPLQPGMMKQRDELEKHLKCQCGCPMDIYLCRTTDFSCPVSPKVHADIEALIELAQSTVKHRFGVELEREVRIVGDAV